MIKELKKDLLARGYRIRRSVSAAIHTQVERLIAPDDDMIVLALVMATANMGLERGTYVEFAATSGMLGPCKLSGNSLPVFEYMVFDKPSMEFVRIKVEIAKPDRIEFVAVIDAKGTADPARHGEVIDAVDAFKRPFLILAHHLYNYWPHGQSPACRQFDRPLSTGTSPVPDKVTILVNGGKLHNVTL